MTDRFTSAYPTTQDDRPTHLVVVDANHDHRIGWNLLNGIQVSDGIDDIKTTIPPLAWAQPPRPSVVAVFLQFIQARGSPFLHELVLVVVGGWVRAQAFLSQAARLFRAVATEGRGSMSGGKGQKSLPETPLLGFVERLCIRNDPLGSGVGIKGGGAGYVVCCGRHGG